ncbi:unnamed protein product [Tetraodon nigroviridis]|uniref:Chromosome 3 SCAF15018, whole genome shotgun sequence n=1 Tax=Tetraodon nigroviridis TaxID=99883 RepID=Q4RMU0_TETNG|nr:unnamed protein product [Tetraodon nigroviridis]
MRLPRRLQMQSCFFRMDEAAWRKKTKTLVQFGRQPSGRPRPRPRPRPRWRCSRCSNAPWEAPVGAGPPTAGVAPSVDGGKCRNRNRMRRLQRYFRLASAQICSSAAALTTFLSAD